MPSIYNLPVRTEIFGGIILFLAAAFILVFLIPALWQIAKLRETYTREALLFPLPVVSARIRFASP